MKTELVYLKKSFVEVKLFYHKKDAA